MLVVSAVGYGERLWEGGGPKDGDWGDKVLGTTVLCEC